MVLIGSNQCNGCNGLIRLAHVAVAQLYHRRIVTVEDLLVELAARAHLQNRTQVGDEVIQKLIAICFRSLAAAGCQLELQVLRLRNVRYNVGYGSVTVGYGT